MSSTRKAKDDSVFHQDRYASSPEFERGLIANLVAKRAALLDAPEDRELVWAIQHRFRQPGGGAALAKNLIAKFPDRLQTPAMVGIGMKSDKVCRMGEVKAIRAEIPADIAEEFLLRGEQPFLTIISGRSPAAADKSFQRKATGAALGFCDNGADQHPDCYPASAFLDLCRDAARKNLEKHLCKICLDPETSLNAGPWYFPNLIESLREYLADLIKTKSLGQHTTALGQKVCDVLDYTAYYRGLTLMQGGARMGKSHAARAWVEQHSGQARFIEVPPGNDDASFFRALARGLGLGNFLSYKVVEIRSRVESVLLTGDILLVLDESQRLWPQRNVREAAPNRIIWVMSMANNGVPIAMISTPQFLEIQKSVEKKGWNSAQLTGRISHYEPLPADLSLDDLKAVAKTILPEADSDGLKALAIYARSSARYLAAIDSVAKRARYVAKQDGRTVVGLNDIRKAMTESVIPADTKLLLALEAGGKGRRPKEFVPSVVSSGEEQADPESQPVENLPGRSRRDSVSPMPPMVPGGVPRTEKPASLVDA